MATGLIKDYSIAKTKAEYVNPMEPNKENHEMYMEYFRIYKIKGSQIIVFGLSPCKFYKDAWEELDRLIEAALKQRKEENMKTNTRVNGRSTFT